MQIVPVSPPLPPKVRSRFAEPNIHGFFMPESCLLRCLSESYQRVNGSVDYAVLSTGLRGRGYLHCRSTVLISSAHRKLASSSSEYPLLLALQPARLIEYNMRNRFRVWHSAELKPRSKGPPLRPSVSVEERFGRATSAPDFARRRPAIYVLHLLRRLR